MRLGIFELGTIIVILLIIFLVARVVRGSKNNSIKKERPIAGQTTNVEERIREMRRQALRRTGIIFLAFAAITILACVSLFRWLMWGYVVFFLTLLIGLVLLYISRKA